MNSKYMQLAINEAREGIQKGDGGPFGCIIVKNDKVVGKGHNMVLATDDCTAHGEIEAIRNACTQLGTYDLSGCDLYTTSAPCPMCQGAIQWANIKKIYTGCNIQDAENIGFRDKVFHENPPTIEEIDRESCLELFNEYKHMEKIIY